MPVNPNRRVIMRIELTPPAKEKMSSYAEVHGMTQVSVTSRLVEFFAAQPETIQQLMLRQYPAAIEADVVKIILKHMEAK